MELIEKKAAVDVAMQYCPDDDGTCSKGDRDIRELLDDLENLPSAQPEPSIPISWIKKKIDWLVSLDNAFSSLTANTLSVMVKQYEEEHESDADTEG